MQRRSTKQRETILSVLKKAKNHLSADELLSRVKKEIPSVNAATLYRNLHVLEESGDVVRVSVASRSFFEISGPSHSHFFCRSCERLIGIHEEALPTPSKEAIRTSSGFTAESVSLIVEGECSLCSSEEAEQLSERCSTCRELCKGVISSENVAAPVCPNV